MAVRMEDDGKRVAGSDLLRAEMEAYKRGDMSVLAMHALTNYNSSGDYWKVILDTNGKVARVIDDGDYDHINVFDAGGKQQRSVAYTSGESLVNAILSGAEGLPSGRRGDADWERVNRAMVTSGLDWDEKSGWYAKTDQAKTESVKAIEERNGSWNIRNRLSSLKKNVEEGLTSVTTKIVNKIGDSTDKLFRRGIYGKKYNVLKNRYDAVADLPYSRDKTAWKMNEDGIFTSDSKGFNCIGFVTYMYNIEPKYDVANFEKYDQFESLDGIKSFKNLQIGDVIRWQGVEIATGEVNNHVQIYAGNGYVWESADSSMKHGVRYWEFSKMLNYYKNPKNIKQETLMIDYFRFKKEEAQK